MKRRLLLAPTLTRASQPDGRPVCDEANSEADTAMREKSRLHPKAQP